MRIVWQDSHIGLFDSDNIENTEYQRGKELAQLLTRLGPTFIKVGQSLSVRS